MKARIREPEYEMSYEYYKDHCIRYVNVNGYWWAVLKDICDAMDLTVDGVSRRLPPDMMMMAPIPTEVRYNGNQISSRVANRGSASLNGIRIENKPMLVVNSKGTLFAFGNSRKLEARQFQMWNIEILDKLRVKMGIGERETFRMLDKEVQDEISYWLDDLYWDEERKCVMQSVTVQGGDVEQVPFI